VADDRKKRAERQRRLVIRLKEDVDDLRADLDDAEDRLREAQHLLVHLQIPDATE
jgi:hypothetical protein